MALNKLSIDKLDLKDKRVLIRYVCSLFCHILRCIARSSRLQNDLPKQYILNFDTHIRLTYKVEVVHYFIFVPLWFVVNC